MRGIVFLLLIIIVMETGAEACVESALLRDADYFATDWSDGSVTIYMWDSPSMVRAVGILRPGALVRVVEKSEGFLKVRAPDAEGGRSGWVSQYLVERTFSRPAGTGPEECGETISIQAGPIGPVKKGRGDGLGEK